MYKSLLAAVLGLTLSTSAFAQENRYAMVCMENRTNITVNYSFKWGEDSAWQTYSLAPGQSRWHSWEYAYINQNHSPRPYVRFDEDLSDAIQYKDYELVAYASPYQDCSYAKRYAFVKIASGRFLDLKYEN